MNTLGSSPLGRVVLLAATMLSGCGTLPKDAQETPATEEVAQFNARLTSYSDCLDTKIAALPASEPIPQNFITDCYPAPVTQEKAE